MNCLKHVQPRPSLGCFLSPPRRIEKWRAKKKADGLEAFRWLAAERSGWWPPHEGRQRRERAGRRGLPHGGESEKGISG